MEHANVLARHLVPAPAAARPLACGRAASAPAADGTAAARPSDATVALANGVAIPAVGFGCVKTKDTMAAALESGYLHLDTARVYGKSPESPLGGGSERAIGELRRSPLWSDGVFLTTKVTVMSAGATGVICADHPVVFHSD